MEAKKQVNVNDQKRRSSLRQNVHPDEMHKMFEKKNLHFDLDPISEEQEVSL